MGHLQDLEVTFNQKWQCVRVRPALSEVHRHIKPVSLAGKINIVQRGTDLAEGERDSGTSTEILSSTLYSSTFLPRMGVLGQAMQSDVADVQGGTAAEGIDIGAMAGTVDLVLRCLTGMRARGQVLRFDPAMPPQIK
jgi:hypothetical protein